MAANDLDQRSEAFMRGLWDATKAKAAGMAAYAAPGMGGRELSDEEIAQAWNTRALSVEQEWDLWRQRKPDGSPQYTPEEIGMQVFPHREKLAKSGGRVEPKDWIGWANRRAEHEQKKLDSRQQEGTTDG